MNNNGNNSKKAGKNNIDTMEGKTIVLSHEEKDYVPQRLDAFLLQHFPDYSRSYFQKLIRDHCVTVNSKIAAKSLIVRPNDIVKISFPLQKALRIKPQEVQFEIIDTQKDFFVINKPAGLTVHHTKEQQEEATLVSGLLHRFKEFCDFDDQERPGIVHRLDKGTSGLLLVARNIKAHIALTKLFKDRLIQKTYLAVVKGHPEPEGKVDFPIGRHPVERHKMSHVSYTGKPALTYYDVLQYYDDCALVRVRLVTGRTHQIRVHFAAIGHGLLGDEMYGVRSKLIKRQALHAWKIAFDFQKRSYTYFCPVPDDFKKLLKTLKPKRIALNHQ